uniref:Uncharacterized protein n=1 Tax=Rhizophora mucronata TaxID=61149 RepID=A0A2P2IR84_RHIMU
MSARSSWTFTTI